jgi:hypothetical protein
MPTKAQMTRVVDEIRGLREDYCFKRLDQVHVALASHGRGTEDDYFFWGELTRDHQRDALVQGIDWEGFDAAERTDVIVRVLDEEPSHRWMVGIEQYNPKEDFARPLTEKEHAAYLSDIAASYGMTVEEMDGYYERMEDEGNDDLDATASRSLPGTGDEANEGSEPGRRSGELDRMVAELEKQWFKDGQGQAGDPPEDSRAFDGGRATAATLEARANKPFFGPAEIDPPTEPTSEETPLERAERQLRDWKSISAPVGAAEPGAGDIGSDAAPLPNDGFGMKFEAGKLSVLETEVDWTGVSGEDKEAVLAREVDFSKISRKDLHVVYEDIAVNFGIETDERPARRLFDKANFEWTKTNLERAGDFWEQIDHARDTTGSLLNAVWADEWPSPAAVVDFGLDSQRHYEALYYAIKNGEIEPALLDAAMGYGEKLTQLTRDAPSNPHKDISFHTAWDDLLGRPRPDGPQRGMQNDASSREEERASAAAYGGDIFALARQAAGKQTEDLELTPDRNPERDRER